MDLNTALIIFVLVAILVFLAARMAAIRFFSSLILALLVGYLVLITIRPWQTVEGFVEGNFNALLYLLIIVLVPLLLLIYIILKVFQDRAICY
jgi:CDP-diglyceride synthetase